MDGTRFYGNKSHTFIFQSSIWDEIIMATQSRIRARETRIKETQPSEREYWRDRTCWVRFCILGAQDVQSSWHGVPREQTRMKKERKRENWAKRAERQSTVALAEERKRAWTLLLKEMGNDTVGTLEEGIERRRKKETWYSFRGVNLVHPQILIQLS